MTYPPVTGYRILQQTCITKPLLIYNTIHTHTHTQNTRLNGYSKNSQADMVIIKRPVKHSTGSSEHMWLLIDNQMTFKYYNPAITLD